MLINRENAQLIDVREPNEYVNGHLADSRNIPAGSLAERAGGGTLMVIATTFPSAEAMEQIIAMGMEEGLMAAMGQMDALLT